MQAPQWPLTPREPAWKHSSKNWERIKPFIEKGVDIAWGVLAGAIVAVVLILMFDLFR
jgi:hypothetical protein